MAGVCQDLSSGLTHSKQGRRRCCNILPTNLPGGFDSQRATAARSF